MSTIHMNLTAKGQALSAKIQKGNGKIPLQITRVVSASSISDDPLNLERIEDLEIRQTAIITRQEQIGSRAVIEVQLSNQGNPATGEPPLAAGYELFQLGMGATDPDEGEILYRISQFETSTWVPPATELGWTINPSWNFVVGNATQVIVEIDPSGMATTGQLNDHINRTIFIENGVHGIRFINGTLQGWDGSDWIDITRDMEDLLHQHTRLTIATQPHGVHGHRITGNRIQYHVPPHGWVYLGADGKLELPGESGDTGYGEGGYGEGGYGGVNGRYVVDENGVLSMVPNTVRFADVEDGILNFRPGFASVRDDILILE